MLNFTQVNQIISRPNLDKGMVIKTNMTFERLAKIKGVIK